MTRTEQEHELDMMFDSMVQKALVPGQHFDPAEAIALSEGAMVRHCENTEQRRS